MQQTPTLAGVRLTCLLACVALAACSNGGGEDKTPMPHPAGPATTTIVSPATSADRANAFVSDAWGFRIDIPPGWTVRSDFRLSYLANGAWKSFASPASHGQSVVALTVPGSNKITDAEIRIGASRDAQELHDCTTPPSAVRAGSVEARTINGVGFTTFEGADAAMSHHLDVHAYRTVRNGTCYAIDLLVFGVNPAVYDPPAAPPFSDAHAFAAMRDVLQSLQFMESADHPSASASTVSR